MLRFDWMKLFGGTKEVKGSDVIFENSLIK